PPDQFTVIRKPPLVIPPNFSLRPPVTAGLEPEKTATVAKARAALLGQSPGVATAASAVPEAPKNTLGEQALLTLAGAERATPGIRQVILRETTLLEEKDQSFTERLIFWQKKELPSVVINPKKEAERLRNAAAKGEPPTSGETAMIKRRKRAILEGIF
ncbi:MAG: DUF3035 domain-containing protein, partial [Proteobacteria bacterium]|nr:DUF3035 domain-containing protein [Pseudomonadota bacterium]